MNELFIAGGGSGKDGYMLPIVREITEKADYVIASERFLKILKVKNGILLKNVYEIIEKIPDILEKGSVVLVVSGDPLMYSMYRTIRERLPDIKIQVFPGIGSLQILGCRFGITLEDAKIMSIHGRECTSGSIARAISENRKVFFYCSADKGPKEIAEIIKEYDIKNTEIFVGENLTYENERLYHGTPDEISKTNNSGLCVAAVQNSTPSAEAPVTLLPDSAFIRDDKTPMTKEEVRAIVIGKLMLRPEFIVWDIGAGTGSISVECARLCRSGRVYSVEMSARSCETIKKNKEYYGLSNLEIINDRAENAVMSLPEPDCVFIGGSGGEMLSVLERIFSINKNIRLVISAVTLETQAQLFDVLKKHDNFRTVQINISNDRKIGSYRIMESNNPVLVFYGNTKEQING